MKIDESDINWIKSFEGNVFEINGICSQCNWLDYTDIPLHQIQALILKISTKAYIKEDIAKLINKLIDTLDEDAGFSFIYNQNDNLLNIEDLKYKIIYSIKEKK